MARPAPTISWWVCETKRRVNEAIEHRPDILNRLGHLRPRFVNWCSRYYVGLNPDLDNDIEEFEAKFAKTRLESVDVKLLMVIRKQIFKRDNSTCQYCAQVGGRLELDHIIPISKGGSNFDNNLTTACFRCNRQKRDKTVEEFQSGRTNHNV